VEDCFVFAKAPSYNSDGQWKRSKMLVNGVIMIKYPDVQDDLFPGQPIHVEHEAEGGFEPLEKESYIDNLDSHGNE
jgi:hypothetical protein